MHEVRRVSADASTFVPALAAALDGGDAVFPARDAAAGPPLGAVHDGVALVVESSGSTAAPKRVALSAAAIRASVDATHQALGGAGAWVLALPLHYVAGAMVVARCLVAGTQLALAAPGSAGIVAAIGRMDATRRRYLSVVPSQLDDLLALAERDARAEGALRSLDAVLVGGQRIDDRLFEAAGRLGVKVVRTYGSSETAGGCVYDGLPIGDTQVRIGADGRIQIASSTLADGYLDPQATREAFVTDAGRRWWVSGDLGAVDAAGTVTVSGRADDVIISGGIKVSLGEVASALHALPGLAEAVVVPVADAHWGQASVVFASAATSQRVSLSEVRAFVAQRFGVAARPRDVVWLDAGLPTTSTGKPDRRALAAKAATMDVSVSESEDSEW